jgi:hypothetical protein
MAGIYGASIGKQRIGTMLTQYQPLTPCILEQELYELMLQHDDNLSTTNST